MSLDRYASTADEVERFMKSTVFNDFEMVIGETLESLHKDLEGAETLDDLRYYQGYIAALRWVLEVPQAMLEELEERAIEERRKKSKPVTIGGRHE